MALGSALTPNQNDHIITKVSMEDSRWKDGKDLLPSRNCFIMFPVLYKTVHRDIKIINIKLVSFPKNVISVHAQNFGSILIC